MIRMILVFLVQITIMSAENCLLPGRNLDNSTCIFCESGFYNSDSDGARTFPKKNCIIKKLDLCNGTRIAYILPVTNSSDETISSLRQKFIIYRNFPEAFFREDLWSSSNCSIFGQKVNFKLLNGDHYIFPKDLNALGGVMGFFERNKMEIEISPLYCFEAADEMKDLCHQSLSGTGIIYLKSKSFKIFVTSKLLIRNIIINGVDLNLEENQNHCSNLPKICCPQLSRDCIPDTSNAILANMENYIALFTLEPIMDEFGVLPPEINIVNVTFESLVYTRTVASELLYVPSALILIYDFEGIVRISNSTFSKCFFNDGILRKILSIRAIYWPILSLLNMTQTYNFRSSIFFQSSLIVDYNHQKIQILKDLSSDFPIEIFSLFSFANFKGQLTIKNNKIMNSQLLQACLVEVTNKNNMSSFGEIIMSENVVFNNRLKFILIMGDSYSRSSLSGVFVGNKFWLNEIMYFIELNHIKNFTLTENFSPPFKPPHLSFIRASFSVLFITDCSFSDLLVELKYSLIEITSIYSVSDEDVFTLSRRISGVFYSNETTYIKNLVIKNSSVSLFSNVNLNFVLRIESSLFENLYLESFDSKSFIILLSEGLFSINNVTFITISTKVMLINLVRFLNASINQMILKNITIFNNPIILLFSFTECNPSEHQANITFFEASNINFLTNADSGKICVIYCLASESGKAPYLGLNDILLRNIYFDKPSNWNNVLFLDQSGTKISNIYCFNISNAILVFTSGKIRPVDVIIDHFVLNNTDSKGIISFLECGIAYYARLELNNSNFYSKILNSSKAMGWNFANKVIIFNVIIEAYLESGTVIFTQPTRLSFLYIENLNMRSFPGSRASLLTIITEIQESDFPFNDYRLIEKATLEKNYPFGIINSTFQSSYESAVVLLVRAQIIIKHCIFKDLSAKEGGLIKLTEKSEALLFNISVFNCFSENRGGCFFVEDSAMVVINARITSSSSKMTGGCLNAVDSNLTLVNVLVFNSSSVRGGVIFGDSCQLSIIKSKFRKAFATIYGAHIVLKDSVSLVFMTDFQEGNSTHYGASLYLESSHICINGSSFIGCVTREAIIFFNQGLNVSVLENIIFYNNSVIASSAILYLKDLNITLNRSSFSNNLAKDGYLIHAFGFSSIMFAQFEFLIISGNILNKRLFLLSEAIIYITYSIVRDNYVAKGNSFNIINSTLEINSSLISQSHIIQKNDEDPCYIIKAKKGSVIVLATSFMDMNHSLSCLLCVSCQSITVFKTALVSGTNEQGGLFNLLKSSFVSKLLFASKNHASQGGVIYGVQTSITLEDSCLSENFASTGSDIMTHSPETSIFPYLNISGSLFFFISGGSVNATSVMISLTFTVFLGSDSKNFSQALFALNCPLITLNDDFFGFFKNRSVINIENHKPKIMNITIYRCKFEDSTNSNGIGAFLAFYGFNAIFIKSTIFSNGLARRGGAVYIKNASNFNSLVTLSECLFKGNKAYMAGGAISSETLQLNFSDDVRFESNEAPTGENISFFPNRLLLISLKDNPSTLEEMKKYRADIKNSYIQNNFQNYSGPISAMSIKPGTRFSLAVIVLDEVGNIQLNMNDYIAQLNVFYDPCFNDSNHAFMKNLAEIVNGIGIFANVTLIGSTNTIIYAVVSLNDGHLKINSTIKVEVLKCNTGDSYQDAKCEKCPEKFYSLEENPEAKNSSCLKCPENADCHGGNIIVPRAYFWRKDFRSPLILPCKVKAGCPRQDIALFSNNTPYEFMCAHGYEGNLCQACSKGYGFMNDTCHKCENSVIYFLLILLSGVVIYLAFLHIEEKSSLKSNQEIYVPLLKILVNHISIFIILTAIKINWSDSFQAFLNFGSLYISTSPSTVYSIECFFGWDKNEKFYYKIIFAGLSPLILVVIAIAKNLFYNILKYYCSRGRKLRREIYFYIKAHSKIDWLLLELFKYVSILFINLYPPLLLTMFQAFSCNSIDLSANKYLTQVPWVLCESQYHKKVRFISAMCIAVWGVFFPIILLCFSRKIIRNTKNKIKVNFDFKQKMVDASFINYIQNMNELNKKIFVNYLTQGYKSHLIWWEITVFSRKLILFCIAGFSEEMDNASICGLSIAVLTNYFFATLFFKPYCKESLNYFEVFSILISISSIILGLITSLDDSEFKYNLDSVCYLTLVTLNLLFFVFWCFLFFHIIFKKFYDKYLARLIFSIFRLKDKSMGNK